MDTPREALVCEHQNANYLAMMRERDVYRDQFAAERDRGDRAEAALADADEKWRFEHELYEDAILQRDAARKKLSNAPHDGLCAVWEINGGESDNGCTCWKSEATA